ncbi:MAG: S8 family serine peptidase [Bdellovibrio sp.]|nr:S8 family serine peptidase [Bdellovibrio sp.]
MRLRKSLAFLLMLPTFTWALAPAQTDSEDFLATNCPQKVQLTDYETLCDVRGTLRRQQRLFSTGKPSLIYAFDKNGRLEFMQTFNFEGEKVQYETYSPQADGSYLVYANGKISAQLAITFTPQMTTRKIRTWNYNNGKLSFVDTYEQNASGESDPVRSEIYGADEMLERIYTFKHGLVAGVFKIIEEFKHYSANGKLVGHFSSKDNVRPPMLTTAVTRQPVVIIDTGFDYHHPEISRVLSQKHLGLYDDPQLLRTDSSDIREVVMLPLDRKPPFPISHGTHVASLAFKDIQKFELVGFAGDYSQASYLQHISEFIKRQRVPFANMSFGFGTKENPFGVNDQSRFALIDLLASNPETLFVIAAGNAGLEVHQERNDDLPASAPVKNKLVIAALNRGDYEDYRKSKTALKLATFSNFGEEEVDLAAPGDQVNGALIGGGSVRLSGTSMAAPLALNAAMKVKEINPALQAWEIKRLLCETAFIPAQPLPVRCKGTLDERRARIAAKLSIEMNLTDAILRSAQVP